MIWDVKSGIGKIISSTVANSVPIFLAAIAFVVCQRLNFSSRTASFISMLVGLIGVIPTTVVGMIMACLSTGDCL